MADMAVQRDAMEAAGPYDRARALNAFKLGDVTFYWVTRARAISVLLILGGIILTAKSAIQSPRRCAQEAPVGW